jgi:hypothetical protein
MGITLNQTPVNFFNDAFFILFDKDGKNPLLPGNANLIAYLSALMSNRIRSDAVFKCAPGETATLTERLVSDSEVKNSAEFAFFMTAVFPDFLSRHGNITLYEGMGSRLYEVLGRHPEKPEDGSNYMRMAREFRYYRRMASTICKGIVYETEITDGSLIIPKFSMN